MSLKTELCRKRSSCRKMTIRMENLERLTLAEMEEFVSNNGHVCCAAVEKEAAYGFIERVLKIQQYRRLSKGQKGIVRRFLGKISGLSRAQTDAPDPALD